MKPSELTVDTVIKYARIEEGAAEIDPQLLLQSALAYVKGYTGLDDAAMDDHEDLSIAILVLCSDLYDNRQMTVDRANINRTVQTILDLHSVNLV